MFSQKEKTVIYDAFDMYYAEYCKTLPSNEELSHITFTKEFEQKMQKLIDREQKFYFYWINTVGKRVAVILLAVLIGLGTITFSVKAFREPTISFIIETFEKFTRVVFSENIRINSKDYFKKATITYVPEGFTLDFETEESTLYQARYFNEDKTQSFIFMQAIKNGSIVNANTEDVIYENINIKDCEGIYYSNKGNNTIVMDSNKYVITITGTISKEELIKIFEKLDDPQFKPIYPKYIPEGYTKDSEENLISSYNILYHNHDKSGNIMCSQYLKADSAIYLNTENEGYEDIIINNQPAILYSNKGTNTVVMSGDKYVFIVETTAEKEELIKIAESIDVR